MNALLENNYITEIECGSNFSYVLNDNTLFLSTEYKVLQSRSGGCFVKCMKMSYNGKIQLYYLTEAYRAFADMIPLLDAEGFWIFVTNLLSDIVDVKQNGFLSCRNIDISYEHLYVDPATYKVKLVYLPLKRRLFDEEAGFENEIRTGLVKLISDSASLSTPKTRRLASELSDGTLSMEDLCRRVKGTPNIQPQNAGILWLITMNVPQRVEIPITKDNFTIGRKKEVVDGLVTINPKIGRKHCRIDKNGEQYTVTDLASTNGTFVNGRRLQPGQAQIIRSGDVLRLANTDFQLSIRERGTF